MKKRIIAMVAIAALASALSVGLVLFYPVAGSSDTVIALEDEPVALGAETEYDSFAALLCTGQGLVEVSPYRSGYTAGESVTFTAVAEEGWMFDHWEGDMAEYSYSDPEVSVRIPKGDFIVVAVFVEE